MVNFATFDFRQESGEIFALGVPFHHSRPRLDFYSFWRKKSAKKVRQLLEGEGAKGKEGERNKRRGISIQSQHTMQSVLLHNIAAVSESSSSSFVDCFDLAAFAAAVEGGLKNKTGAQGRNSFSGGQSGRTCGQRGRRS